MPSKTRDLRICHQCNRLLEDQASRNAWCQACRDGAVRGLPPSVRSDLTSRIGALQAQLAKVEAERNALAARLDHVSICIIEAFDDAKAGTDAEGRHVGADPARVAGMLETTHAELSCDQCNNPVDFVPGETASERSICRACAARTCGDCGRPNTEARYCRDCEPER